MTLLSVSFTERDLVHYSSSTPEVESWIQPSLSHIVLNPSERPAIAGIYAPAEEFDLEISYSELLKEMSLWQAAASQNLEDFLRNLEEE